jgi:hypothetical protein
VSHSAGYIRSIDHGYKALLKRVWGFGHPQIVTGIVEADGAKPKKPWPEGTTVEEALDVITVAGWMEFGFTIVHPDGTTEIVPARSFIRAWFDQAEPRKREELAKLMHGVISGHKTKEQVLELLGASCVGEIQERISAGIDPENKQSTIDRKGSSKPLIASGQMRGSVTFAVREGGK